MPAHTRTTPRERQLILAAIGAAQLMVVLDATVVNIALPSAQRALGFSTDLRQWIVTAYALAFGSLLPLGGRLGDLFGRKRTLIVGLIGFGVASAVGGAAQSFAMLVTARAVQGIAGALLAPSVLALLTTTFTEGRERNRAYAVFAGIAVAGGAIGLLVGGALTEWLSWRYSLFINLVLAVPAIIGVVSLVANDAHRSHQPLDLPGAVTACGGLFGLVYGFSNAETHSWSAPLTVIMLAAAVVLLASFFVIETRSRHPLLPTRVILDRARGGSYLTVGTAGLAMFGAFLFVTYYLQETLNLSPVRTGLAFLPMMVPSVICIALVNTKLLHILGPRPLITVGLLLAAGAMVWLAQLTATSSYFGGVMPALILLGMGMGSANASAIYTSTYQVDRHEAGIASALVNTMQQVGGAIGAAILSTIFASAVKTYLHTHAPSPTLVRTATVHGYTTTFWISAAILAVGAICLGALLPSIGASADAGTAGQPVAEDPTAG